MTLLAPVSWRLYLKIRASGTARWASAKAKPLFPVPAPPDNLSLRTFKTKRKLMFSELFGGHRYRQSLHQRVLAVITAWPCWPLGFTCGTWSGWSRADNASMQR
jgi:hypothetical protein